MQARTVIAGMLVASASGWASAPASAAPPLRLWLEPTIEIGGTEHVVVERLAPARAGEPYRYLMRIRAHFDNTTGKPMQILDFNVVPGYVGLGRTLPPGETSLSSGQSWEFDTPPSSVRFYAEIEGGALVERTYPVSVHRHRTRSGAYRFPARSSDLPPGVLWMHGISQAGESHHNDTVVQNFAYDFGNVRWDGSEWVHYVVGGEDRAQNQDFLIWNRPVYTMADGTVLFCRRTHADNPAPPKSIADGGGNFLYIQHATGEVALYAHFRQDTVPVALCPKETLTEGDLAEPVKVREGQLLGRVGNSGSSSGPHLHLHLQDGFPDKGATSLPLAFDRIATRRFREPPKHWNPTTTPGFANVPIGQRGAPVSDALIDPNPCGWAPPQDGLRSYTRTGIARRCFYEVVDEAVARGYQVARIDGFEALGEPYYNIVFTPAPALRGTSTQFAPSLTEQAFEDMYLDLAGKGARVASLDAYRRFGEIRYAAVFRFGPGPEQRVYADMSSTLLASRTETLEDAGFRLTQLSAAAEGTARFSAVYERTDVGAFVVDRDVRLSEAAVRFSDLRAKGLQPLHVDAYTADGETRFATVWTSGAPTASLPYGLTLSATTTRPGWPEVVTGYQNGLSIRYAGIWRTS